MDRTELVAAALREAGEAARIERAEIPELTDDDVILSDGLRVQVGETYLVLVRPNADGTFTFFREAESLAHLLRQIREAREEGAPGTEGEDARTPAAGAAASSDDVGSEGVQRGVPAPVALPFASDQLPTRDAFTAAGGVLQSSPVDGADYALLPPCSTRRCFSVLRYDEGGSPSVVAESTTEAGASELLVGYLDGTHQASADRYFAWLAAREAAVRPEVAEALRAAGYTVYNTGGNCLAWMRPLTDTGTDSYILICTDAGIEGDAAAAEWLVGRWDGDGWINLLEELTLADAIRTADLLPRAAGRDGEPIEGVYPTLAAAIADLSSTADANDG